MVSAERDQAASSVIQSEESPDRRFEIAHGELRLGLIKAIARRVGQSVEPVSIQEACSKIPLAELYHRKLYTNRFAEVVERLLFRWWR
jgi:hypothetical protein